MRPVALAFLAASAFAAPAMAADPVPGQAFLCRSKTTASSVTVVLGKVDHAPDGRVVVSVSLFNDAADAVVPTIAHLPFDIAAIDSGCTPSSAQRSLSDNFEDGYAYWRKAFDEGQAGAFTLPPTDIYDMLLQQVPAQQGQTKNVGTR